jgi:hypothetical protein
MPEWCVTPTGGPARTATDADLNLLAVASPGIVTTASTPTGTMRLIPVVIEGVTLYVLAAEGRV